MNDLAASTRECSDRAVAWLTFAATLFANIYDCQVEGVNQNAHFAAVRSLVERGTFDITRRCATRRTM